MKEQWEQECADLRAELAALQKKLHALETNQGGAIASAPTLSRWRLSKRMMMVLLPVVALLAAGGVLYGQGAMDALFIDKDGKVGIGTTTPSAKLEVSLGNPNGWNGNLRGLRLLSPDEDYALDVNAHVIESGNVGYHFSPNNQLGLEITTPGNVGIGTMKPEAKLDVRGKTLVQSLSFTDGSGTSYADNWVGMADNVLDDKTKWLHIGGITDQGKRRIALYANTTYIDGDVGIWTKKPEARLHVNGDIKATNITFTSQKVCSVIMPANWRDTIIVPATWSKKECDKFRANTGASTYQLACIFENDISWGAGGEGVPSRNCGW
jgi:hypothetical protein